MTTKPKWLAHEWAGTVELPEHRGGGMRLALYAISSFMSDASDRTWRTHATIAQRANLTVEAFSANAAKLVELGVVYRERQHRADGSLSTWAYWPNREAKRFVPVQPSTGSTQTGLNTIPRPGSTQSLDRVEHDPYSGFNPDADVPSDVPIDVPSDMCPSSVADATREKQIETSWQQMKETYRGSTAGYLRNSPPEVWSNYTNRERRFALAMIPLANHWHQEQQHQLGPSGQTMQGYSLKRYLHERLWDPMNQDWHTLVNWVDFLSGDDPAVEEAMAWHHVLLHYRVRDIDVETAPLDADIEKATGWGLDASRWQANNEALFKEFYDRAAQRYQTALPSAAASDTDTDDDDDDSADTDTDDAVDTDTDDALLVFSALKQYKGTDVAEAMKAWAVQQGRSASDFQLHNLKGDSDWRDAIADKLEQVLSDGPATPEATEHHRTVIDVDALEASEF